MKVWIFVVRPKKGKTIEQVTKELQLAGYDVHDITTLRIAETTNLKLD